MTRKILPLFIIVVIIAALAALVEWRIAGNGGGKLKGKRPDSRILRSP